MIIRFFYLSFSYYITREIMHSLAICLLILYLSRENVVMKKPIPIFMCNICFISNHETNKRNGDEKRETDHAHRVVGYWIFFIRVKIRKKPLSCALHATATSTWVLFHCCFFLPRPKILDTIRRRKPKANQDVLCTYIYM